jgi:CDP-4-dehydro-6-deoxyglucose reductase
MTAKKMQGRVVYKANLAGKTWLVGVELEEVVDYLPGQFVSLKVSEEGLRRSYSVASLSGKKVIDLVVDIAPMGVGSQYVLGLKVGESVEVIGFLGKFTVNEDILESRKELLFVGTGTGIAPLKPMIEDLLVNKGFRGQVYLVWGMRYETDLYWIKEIDKLQRDFDNFHFETVLSKPGSSWPGIQGHVGDFIREMNLEWKKINVYLCGNPEMITEVREILINKEVTEERILHERFA